MLELAPRLDDSLKINKTTTKYILRELSKQYLPDELLTQPKRGFEVPLKKWVDFDLKEQIFDLTSSNCYATEFIDKAFIANLKERKIATSDEKRAKILWDIFCLEMWRKNQ
jgi:asparagine synthase (glutamine-hydrolysing)